MEYKSWSDKFYDKAEQRSHTRQRSESISAQEAARSLSSLVGVQSVLVQQRIDMTAMEMQLSQPLPNPAGHNAIPASSYIPKMHEVYLTHEHHNSLQPWMFIAEQSSAFCRVMCRSRRALRWHLGPADVREGAPIRPINDTSPLPSTFLVASRDLFCCYAAMDITSREGLHSPNEIASGLYSSSGPPPTGARVATVQETLFGGSLCILLPYAARVTVPRGGPGSRSHAAPDQTAMWVRGPSPCFATVCGACPLRGPLTYTIHRHPGAPLIGLSSHDGDGGLDNSRTGLRGGAGVGSAMCGSGVDHDDVVAVLRNVQAGGCAIACCSGQPDEWSVDFTEAASPMERAIVLLSAVFLDSRFFDVSASRRSGAAARNAGTR